MRKWCTKFFVHISVVLLGGIAGTNASESASSNAFQYDDYAQVLKNYVNDAGLVDYKGLKANPDNLNGFLQRIARLQPDTFRAWPENERLAFWLNAYNAVTLKIIVENYPIKSTWVGWSMNYPKNSIQQIPGVWDTITYPVLGREMSLNAIEHDTIRVNFNEPRIHFAVNCASIGCPKLRGEPYTAAKLDAQLDSQVKTLMQNPQKFRIENNTLYLNKILSWYGEDFVDQFYTEERFTHLTRIERSVANFFYQYMTAEQKQQLEGRRFLVAYLDYDWSLNELTE